MKAEEHGTRHSGPGRGFARVVPVAYWGRKRARWPGREGAGERQGLSATRLLQGAD